MSWPGRVVRVAFACLVLASRAAHADEAGKSPAGEAPAPAKSQAGLDVENSESSPVKNKKLGLEFTSDDDRFYVNAWLRAQFRFSDPFDAEPRSIEEFDDAPGSDFEVRRARLKVQGHLFSPRVGFYYEQELTGDTPLLDLRLDIKVRDDLQIRLGQHKALYNREQLDSSGKQQFVDRSIANYAFTLDRQIGVTLARHWAEGTRADNWLVLGLYDGDGRGSGARGDEPMLMGRWQWHFLAEPLAFSQSDHQIRSVPAASLAFGASTVRGPYTRFSSSGGGQLDGFEQGGDERYTLTQGFQELAWQYGGYSFQQEFHVKEIKDHEASQRSTLVGGYAQFGKAWPFVGRKHPHAWELAVRVAHVDWEDTHPDRTQDELTLATNLFIAGHNNKLTAEVSRISVDEEPAGDQHEGRVRLQWDVSF